MNDASTSESAHIGMIQHEGFSHSAGLQCDQCPGYPHVGCIPPRDVNAFVWRLHAAVVDAISPDDPTGHIPNCGYTTDVPECGCAAFGERLHRALTEVVTSTGGQS